MIIFVLPLKKMLESQINKKLTRLKNTMDQTVSLLSEVNKNTVTFNQKNKKLVHLAIVYKKWKEKIEYSSNN